MTFGRTYINRDTREGYFHLFSTFFSLVDRYLMPHSCRIAWFHIDGFGMHAIVTDMCSKQAAGMYSICFIIVYQRYTN
jgi:hypothetical protein